MTIPRPESAATLVLALWVSLGFGAVACGTLPPRSHEPAQPAEPAFRAALDWTAGQSADFAADLERCRDHLLRRARAEDPGLLARLERAPAPSLRAGWGYLPEILPDSPPGPVAPGRRRYDLAWLTTAFAADLRDAALLLRRCSAAPAAPLAELVDEYARLDERRRNLEEHLAYHRYWQQALLDWPDFFAGRNALVARADALQQLLLKSGAAAEIERLRAELHRVLAPFQPNRALALRRDPAGAAVLPVRVLTDLADPNFLAAFAGAVERHFNGSAAARAQSFRIELELQQVAPEALHPAPQRAPRLGEAIDLERHLARFPAEALVLTSGAENTHAFAGRCLALGRAPLSSRVLAHEFAHLLGFGDAYLRSSEGDPRARFGAVLVEWDGLFDDLMGAPRTGELSAAMVETLLRAHGAGPELPDAE